MGSVSVSAAVRETLALWRRNGGLFVPLALALFALPGIALSTIAPMPPALGAGGKAAGSPVGLLLLALLVASLVGQLALARLAAVPGAGVGESIRHGLVRLPALLGAMLVALLMPTAALLALGRRVEALGTAASAGLLVGFLFLLVLLVVVALRMMLVVPIAASEPGGPLRLVARSFALSRGQTARLALVLLVAAASLSLVMAASELLGASIVLATLGPPEPLSVSALLIAAIVQLPQALVTAAFVVLIARLYRQRVDQAG